MIFYWNNKLRQSRQDEVSKKIAEAHRKKSKITLPYIPPPREEIVEEEKGEEHEQ